MQKVKEVVKEIPITSISLETDSPYLTPEPYRENLIILYILNIL